MADKMKYYNVDDYTKQKARQGPHAATPPLANLFAAADHVRKVFEKKKLTYGVLGGLEMLCLGHRREIRDLHIAYDDKDFARIKTKLKGDQRVGLPEGMNPLFPSKVLVRTGPAYKDAGCTDAAAIEVNLIPPGFHGTPSNGELRNNLVVLSLKKDSISEPYKGLSLLYLVRTLLHLCRIRDLGWDPRADVLFLCQHYGDQLATVRHELDLSSVQYDFLGTAFFSKLSREDQGTCYRVLVNKEPPPTMALTPPAPFPSHKHSHSAPEVPKLQMASSQLPPSLGTPDASALLIPALPKASGRRQPTISTDAQPAKTTVSSEVLEQVKTARDSRSRYRPVSVPNNRNVSLPNLPPSDGSRTNSLEISPQGSQTLRRTSKMQSMGTPQMANERPELSSTHVQRSTANNATIFSTAANITGQSLRTGNTTVLPPQQWQVIVPLVEMSATPAPYNPGQQHLKSRLGLGQTPASRRRSSLTLPITSNPVPPKVRNVHRKTQPVTGQNSPVYELDAVFEQNCSIAELPADSDVVLHADVPERSRPIFETDTSIRTTLNASITSPKSAPSTSEQHSSIRPTTLRAHSGPLTTLPESLMVGGPHAQRFQSRPTSNQLPVAHVSPQLSTTNPSRYSRYYSPPTSAPNSTHTSPQLTPVPLSIYKAYQPPSPPPTDVERPSTRPTSFGATKDIDGVQHYLRTHRREAGHGSESSCTSQDSSKLAQDYQAGLPDFEDGYGSRTVEVEEQVER